MVIGFMQSRQLVSLEQLGELTCKAMAHFGAEHIEGLGHLKFVDLVQRFKARTWRTPPLPLRLRPGPRTQAFLPPSPRQVLFFKENINSSKFWWRKARLWRLVLSQHKRGYWDPRSSAAFALNASLQPPKTKGRPSLAAKLLQQALSMVAGNELEGLGDLTAIREDLGQRPKVEGSLECPLTFHPEAILYSIPAQLRALGRRLPCAPPSEECGVDAYIARLWTTMLCLHTLERLEISWITDQGLEHTIVDSAQLWLDHQVALVGPALGEVLSSPEVVREVKYWCALWRTVQVERIAQVRWFTTMDASFARQNLDNNMTKGCCNIASALRVKHETLSMFLGPLSLEGLNKWQRWVLVMTLLMLALVIEIWFYWSKGTACCTEVRTLLSTFGDCEPSLSTGVCLGYVGDCGDLKDQFEEQARGFRVFMF